MSEFNVQNSARRIVQEKTNWKSRQLDLGNRHRTTLNFGDLIPAYWQHVLPGDKLKLDCNILAKFMPLIAPAFSRMKIKSEWFFVPLRQISPSSLRALQDFKPDDAVSAFSHLLQHGNFEFSPRVSDDQQQLITEGFPSVPAWWLSAWFAGSTSSTYKQGSSYMGPWSSSNCYAFNGSLSLKHWRTQRSINSSDLDFITENLGLEDFVCFASKNRCRKFLSYLGLPQRLTTMRYFKDVVLCPSTDSGIVSSYGVVLFQDSSNAPVDSIGHSAGLVSKRFDDLCFFDTDLAFVGNTVTVDSTHYGVLSSVLESSIVGLTDTVATMVDGSVTKLYQSNIPCASHSLVTLLPAQAYQKIYNDFYRDEKLQPEEIRYYPYAYWDSSSRRVLDGLSRTNDYIATEPNQANMQYDFGGVSPTVFSSCTRMFNNLFMLRRRNRAKDVLSSCVTDKVLVNRLSNASTAPNVFQSNLFAKLEKYLMKKEFTGSTWAEWLNNFFGENSSDYLNNNVVFLGSKESVVSISENIQTSSSTDDAAQGNRAGLAGDFHAGDSIYFRVPDFGILMCVVSVIPDDADNYNGLQERFCMDSPFSFNLPDFQNIGFAPVFNRRANVGLFDRQLPTSNLPSWLVYSNDVFGYQPFGYHWTYTPNVISGDFQNSLRYWHQSADFDIDFTDFSDSENPEVVKHSWANGQLHLNANLPPIGYRQQPLSVNLANQYYNNIFAVTNDESGDHIVSDMRFFVTCHRNTAFFTDAVGCEQ